MLRLPLFLTLLWLAACAQGEAPTDRMMAHDSAPSLPSEALSREVMGR